MSMFKINSKLSEHFLKDLESMRSIFLHYISKILRGRLYHEVLQHESSVLMFFGSIRKEAVTFMTTVDKFELGEVEISEVRQSFKDFRLVLSIFYTYYSTLDDAMEKCKWDELVTVYEKSNYFFVSNMSDFIEEYLEVLQEFEIELIERERLNAI